MVKIIKKFSKRIIVAEEIKYVDGVITSTPLPDFEVEKRTSLLQIEKYYKDILVNPKATIIVKEEKIIEEVYEMEETEFKKLAKLVTE